MDKLTKYTISNIYCFMNRIAAIKVKCLHKIITFERETAAMLRIKDYGRRLKFNEKLIAFIFSI